MENSLYLTTQAHGLTGWLLRPICLIILGLIVLTVIFSARHVVRSRRTPGAAKPAGDTGIVDPLIGLPLTVLLLVVFAAGSLQALTWPPEVKLFPLTAGIPGIGLALIALAREGSLFLRTSGEAGGVAGLVKASPAAGEIGTASRFMIWLLGILIATLVFGQQVALPAFIALYLVVWGRYRWWVAALYAGAGWAFLYGMFDRIIHVVWYPSLILD
jgi:hypothetical protein